MAVYDLEKLSFDLREICKANIVAKLLAIDTEKADGVTMQSPHASAYFFQALTKAQASQYPCFVFFGMDDPISDGLGPMSVEEVELFFIVMLKDTAENEVYLQRMLRYSRALKEIFQENFNNTPWKNKLKITSVAPVSFQIAGVASTFAGAGVKVWTKF
jgi:hypothetical protein